MDIIQRFRLSSGTNIVSVPGNRFISWLLLFLIGGALLFGSACAQHRGDRSDRPQEETMQDPSPAGAHPERVAVTIFLRHQQTKSLDELLDELKSRKFYRRFPPEDVDVVRWDVVMGIGQIVTVLTRPRDLRSVNTVIEKRAWGSFDTEFYPTYIPEDSQTTTESHTEGITNENYVLFTVLAEYSSETDPEQGQSGMQRPDLSNLPDRIEIETVRHLVGRGTLYTFRVPPDRVAALDRTLNGWVSNPRDLEAYTSYNFLPIHRKITGSAEEN